MCTIQNKYKINNTDEQIIIIPQMLELITIFVGRNRIIHILVNLI